MTARLQISDKLPDVLVAQMRSLLAMLDAIPGRSAVQVSLRDTGSGWEEEYSYDGRVRARVKYHLDDGLSVGQETELSAAWGLLASGATIDELRSVHDGDICFAVSRHAAWPASVTWLIEYGSLSRLSWSGTAHHLVSALVGHLLAVRAHERPVGELMATAAETGLARPVMKKYGRAKSEIRRQDGDDPRDFASSGRVASVVSLAIAERVAEREAPPVFPSSDWIIGFLGHQGRPEWVFASDDRDGNRLRSTLSSAVVRATVVEAFGATDEGLNKAQQWGPGNREISGPGAGDPYTGQADSDGSGADLAGVMASPQKGRA